VETPLALLSPIRNAQAHSLCGSDSHQPHITVAPSVSNPLERSGRLVQTSGARSWWRTRASCYYLAEHTTTHLMTADNTFALGLAAATCRRSCSAWTFTSPRVDGRV
jgi:hypothetical protein